MAYPHFIISILHEWAFKVVRSNFALLKKLTQYTLLSPSQHAIAPLSAHQRNSTGIAFRWRADGGPFYMLTGHVVTCIIKVKFIKLHASSMPKFETYILGAY